MAICLEGHQSKSKQSFVDEHRKKCMWNLLVGKTIMIKVRKSEAKKEGIFNSIKVKNFYGQRYPTKNQLNVNNFEKIIWDVVKYGK